MSHFTMNTVAIEADTIKRIRKWEVPFEAHVPVVDDMPFFRPEIDPEELRVNFQSSTYKVELGRRYKVQTKLEQNYRAMCPTSPEFCKLMAIESEKDIFNSSANRADYQDKVLQFNIPLGRQSNFAKNYSNFKP